ncbi:MAG: MFS transporter [Candidatus Lokiarchaeota archaeon]|nr:MFS transporter [Candidatus Lokiarchaeota archaeon]
MVVQGIITLSVFFVNWSMDAIGRKGGLIILVLIMGIPALLIPLIGFGFHVFMLLYALIIMGTLSNAWEIPMAEESSPKKRGLYGGVVFLIGLFPLYALFGEDIAASLGWRWCYGVMGILMVVILILMYFFKEPDRWHKSKLKRGKLRFKIMNSIKSLTKRDVIYILVSTLVYGIWNRSFKLATTSAKVFFVDFLLYSPDQYQTYITIGGLLTLVAAFLSGFFMDKIGRNKVLIIGCVGATASYCLMGITELPIFLILIYFFMPVVLSWILVYFAEIFPTDVRGTCVGILNIGSRISYIVGPLLGWALLCFLFLPYIAYYIIAGLLMLIPLLALLTKPYETKCKTLEEIELER